MLRRFSLFCCLLAVIAPNLSGQTTAKFKRYVVRGIQPLEAGSISGAELGVTPGPEVLVSGLNANGVVLSQLYFGSEETFSVDRGDTTFVLSYALVTQTLEQVWRSHSLWYDFDGDGDQDLLLMGARNREAPISPVTALYLNDRGTLAPVNPAGQIPGFYDGDAAAGDLFGDGRTFAVIVGRNPDDVPLFAFYELTASTTNNGSPSLRVLSNTFVPSYGRALAALALGDCDADGDLDVAITGVDAGGIPRANLYRNNGTGFDESGQTLPGVFKGGLAFGDIDGDGDADLVLTGATYGPDLLEGVTRLYRSDDCRLTPDPGFAPPATFVGDTALLQDHDGDGDLDLLLNGYEGSITNPLARLGVYLNDGTGVFTNYDQQPGAIYSNAFWLDLNADGFLDPFVGGNTFGVPGVLFFRKPGLPPPPDEGN